MPDQAPRIDPRLVVALTCLDRPGVAIAETHRRVGALASALGLPRPSYEQARTHVHAARRRSEQQRRARRVALELVLDVESRRRPPEALLDLVRLE